MRRLLVLTLASFALIAASANADQRPPGCTGNKLDVRVVRDHAVVRPGASVTYTIFVSNQGAEACDITDATLEFSLPGADGNPSGSRTVAQGLDLPSGSAERQVAVVQWSADVDPGVTDAIARAHLSATLHDAPVNH